MAALLSGLAMPAAAYDEKPMMLKAQASVRQQLSDSRSAEFKDMRAFVHEPLVIVCGAVNSREKAGAETGFRRFVVVNELAFIQGQFNRTRFDNVEEFYCK